MAFRRISLEEEKKGLKVLYNQIGELDEGLSFRPQKFIQKGLAKGTRINVSNGAKFFRQHISSGPLGDDRKNLPGFTARG